LRIKIIY